MFGKKNVYSLANPTEQKSRPSQVQHTLTLFIVSFVFGVIGWHLIRPILGG